MVITRNLGSGASTSAGTRNSRFHSGGTAASTVTPSVRTDSIICWGSGDRSTTSAAPAPTAHKS